MTERSSLLNMTSMREQGKVLKKNSAQIDDDSINSFRGKMLIMIRRALIIAAMFGLITQSAFAQTPVRQARAGEVVRLTEGLTLRVTKAVKSPFASVKVTGEPFAVVLELDAGLKETALSYQITADAKTSEVSLTSGTQRIAPRAVVEDFPSWGEDNDKEVELITPHDVGAASISFRRTGSISVLFDLPAGPPASARKLSLVLRTLKPTEEQHSIVVTF